MILNIVLFIDKFNNLNNLFYRYIKLLYFWDINYNYLLALSDFIRLSTKIRQIYPFHKHFQVFFRLRET